MDKLFCPVCGFELLSTASFCTNCGTEMNFAELNLTQTVKVNISDKKQVQEAEDIPIKQQTAVKIKEKEYEPLTVDDDDDDIDDILPPPFSYTALAKEAAAKNPPSYTVPKYNPVSVPSNDDLFAEDKKKKNPKELTAFQYLFSIILMLIPAVGVIISAVWAFGGSKKPARKNLARAVLILQAVGIILSASAFFAGRSFLRKEISEKYAPAVVQYAEDVDPGSGIYLKKIEDYKTLKEEFDNIKIKDPYFKGSGVEFVDLVVTLEKYVFDSKYNHQ